MKRLLLAIANNSQRAGYYDIAIPLDELELADVLDQVSDFILLAMDEEEGEEDDSTDEHISVSGCQD